MATLCARTDSRYSLNMTCFFWWINSTLRDKGENGIACKLEVRGTGVRL